jgi:hypothetical protein
LPSNVNITTEQGAPVTCAALASRYRGRLVVTVVVKATFALTPDGAATLRPPSPIVDCDRYLRGKPVASLEAASDLAPYKPRVDVTFVGSAHPTAAGASGVARLALFRGAPLLDKTIRVHPPRAAASQPVPILYELALREWGPSGQNPVGTEQPSLVDPRDPRRPIGFGPIRADWPARARFRGQARLDHHAPILDIPDEVDWRYFQVAPPDQQIPALQGGEWLLLEGLVAGHPRLRTQVPSVLAKADVTGAVSTSSALAADTLAIHGEAGTFDVVFRGTVPIAGGEASLAGIRIVARLALAERGAQPQYRAPAAAAASPTGAPRRSDSPAHTTVALAAFDPSALRALPFIGGPSNLQTAAPAARRPRPKLDLDGTMMGPEVAPPMRSPFPLAPAPPGAWSEPRSVAAFIAPTPTAGARRVPLALVTTQPAAPPTAFVAPFAIATPGGQAATSTPPLSIPGAPWAHAPAAPPPAVDDDPLAGTLAIELPRDLRNSLAAIADSAPAGSPPGAEAKQPAKRVPALPLKGQMYGRPRRKKT